MRSPSSDIISALDGPIDPIYTLLSIEAVDDTPKQFSERVEATKINNIGSNVRERSPSSTSMPMHSVTVSPRKNLRIPYAVIEETIPSRLSLCRNTPAPSAIAGVNHVFSLPMLLFLSSPRLAPADPHETSVSGESGTFARIVLAVL